jgi:tRNA(adenine34) deaminase
MRSDDRGSAGALPAGEAGDDEALGGRGVDGASDMAVSDVSFMEAALLLAREAADDGDVPVGAVVVCDGVIVGRGRNRREADGDPISHAEVLALQDAARARGSWRLDGCTLFVTLEPCPMCAGAIVQSRVARLVFGARDDKLGGVRSLFQICDDPRSYHRVDVHEGVLSGECSAILRDFFGARRSPRPHR